MLLIYVDRGRRSVQQLEQLQTAQKEIVLQLGSDHDGKSASCEGTPGGPGPSTPEALGAHSSALFGPNGQSSKRSWRPGTAHPSDFPWSRRELAFDDATRSGGCVDRRMGFRFDPDIGDDFGDQRLCPADALGPVGLVRLCLPQPRPSIVHGDFGAERHAARPVAHRPRRHSRRLLGVLWTNGQQIQLEGVTLSLCAVAFLVGFSVEIVFQTLEAIIAGVASKLRSAP